MSGTTFGTPVSSHHTLRCCMPCQLAAAARHLLKGHCVLLKPCGQTLLPCTAQQRCWQHSAGRAHSLCDLCARPVGHLCIKLAHEVGVVQVCVVGGRLEAHGDAQLVGEGLVPGLASKGGHVVVQGIRLLQELLHGAGRVQANRTTQVGRAVLIDRCLGLGLLPMVGSVSTAAADVPRRPGNSMYQAQHTTPTAAAGRHCLVSR